MVSEWEYINIQSQIILDRKIYQTSARTDTRNRALFQPPSRLFYRITVVCVS